METLQTLAVALGLATLAGLNLYLTVFVTGLAINQGWISLAGQYAHLYVLGEPAIIIIAGVLCFMEFFADKVPWVDTLWDTVHTIIRPIGGAMLAIQVLGETNAVFSVIVALLGGSVSLVAHGAKAGTRLVANGSPEPFSNIALSVGEDVAVLAGLTLIHWNPVVALVVFLSILGSVIYYAPRLLRGVFVIGWLAWKKLTAPAETAETDELPSALSSTHDLIFDRLNVLGEKIVFAVPCISGAGVPANHFGMLIATEEEPRKLYFVAKRRFGKLAETLDVEGYKVSVEPKFLSHNLVIYSSAKKPARYVFLFPRAQAALAERAGEEIRDRLQSPAPLVEPALAAALR